MTGYVLQMVNCRYLELRGIPEECRTARDHILLLAFEKFYKYREEIEELRRTRDSSRFVFFSSFLCIGNSAANLCFIWILKARMKTNNR